MSIEPVAALTHPIDLFGRIPHHKGVVGRTPGNNSSGTNKGVRPDSIAADNSSIRPNSSTFLHEGRPHLVHPRDVGPGIEDVGENHGWSAKDIILKGHPLVYGYIVLDLAAIANDYSRAYNDILTYGAVLPYLRTLEDMIEMPNLRPRTYFDTLIHKARCMHKESLGTREIFERNLAPIIREES